MGIYEFNILSLENKAETVWQEGTYLTMRSELGFKINLYSLSNFFVEVWYSPDENKITQIRSFKSKSQLEAYTNNINLDSLL